MDINKVDGFFLKHYNEVRNGMSSEDIKNFGNIESKEARFDFVHRLVNVEKKLPFIRYDKTVKQEVLNNNDMPMFKDMEKAIEFKNFGNKLFKNQEYNKAIVFYNKSYLMAPGDAVNEVTIILANRSAALYHCKEFDAALKDIDRAIQLKYPKDMLYKLMERKARCYLGKKNNVEALKAFKLTVQTLDDGKISLEKHLKMEKDSQVMIKILQRNIELEGCNNKKENLAVPKPTVGFQKMVNDKLAFVYTENQGRFCSAKEDIKLGENLLREEPHASCLLKEYSQTHCQKCCKRTSVPVACNLCADVIFCSEKCRDYACNTYHKYECGVLSPLWRSGTSITCRMALRIISQKSVDYFVAMKDDLNQQLSVNPKDKAIDLPDLPNDDYRKVFGMVTHDDESQFEICFHRYLMANFLMHLLDLGGYFEGHKKEEVFNFIGNLILHNINILKFNAHEISELQQKNKTDPGESVFIGGGLYPTLALFNHSCDPGIVRYYTGNIVNVRAIKKTVKGEEVAENYGPIFTQTKKDQRQTTLLNQYKFNCNCNACVQVWPLYKEMDDNIIRFRCDGSKTKNCKSVLLIPADIQEFMIKCTECGEFTNIMKGLKSLQDTDKIFKTATRIHESGNYQEALLKYVEMVNILDQSLVPPFRDYHLCQQGIRRCLLEYGNKYIMN